MSYTPAEIAQAAALLVQRIPGLTPVAATTWVTAEQGDNNNIIGVTYMAGGQQHLYQYSTLAQGALAAGNLWGARIYAPFRAAVAATSDPAKQLQAIAASPWNHPYYTSARSGFPAAIARLTGQPAPALTTAAAVSPAGGSSGGGTFQAGPPVTPGASGGGTTFTTDQWNAVIASLPPGTRYLSATNVGLLKASAAAQGIDLSGTDLTKFYGQSISALRDALAAKGIIPGANLLPFNFLDFSWVPSVAVNLAILGTVLVLGYKGLTKTLGE
jgi:hypothetical protein